MGMMDEPSMNGNRNGEVNPPSIIDAWVAQITHTRVRNELRRRAAAGLRESAHQAALRRLDRALRLVTNSEVVPRRLGPAPGINAAAHGNYRGRSGVDLAVLTLS